MLATQRQHSPEPIRLGGGGSSVSNGSPAPVPTDGPVIGLVDELDDPAPGHMSDRPHALTSTTSMPSEPPSLGVTVSAENDTKPMFGGSLSERFVKSSDEGDKATLEGGDDNMSVDEGEADKENVPK